MRPWKKLLAIALVFLLTPGMLFAQQKLSDWSNVEKLKPGAKIIVSTKKGIEFTGEKRQANDDTLFLETALPVHGTRIITLSRDEIAEVRKMGSPALLMFTGGATGAGVGGAIGSGYDRPGTAFPVGSLMVGLVGALIGVTVGRVIHTKAKTKGKKIYVAP